MSDDAKERDTAREPDPRAEYTGPHGITFIGPHARDYRDRWLSLLHDARLGGVRIEALASAPPAKPREGERAAALEEAAKVCDEVERGLHAHYQPPARYCANAIRALARAPAAPAPERGQPEKARCYFCENTDLPVVDGRHRWNDSCSTACIRDAAGPAGGDAKR
jgi:hypothetical protein